jgi:hypothetical protein
MTENEFSKEMLTEEEAFWVMFYFLDGHYKLSDGQFELSDILSASQPFEFDEKGHIDGEVHGNRSVAPADSAMVAYWNEAVKKFREQGRPGVEQLIK